MAGLPSHIQNRLRAVLTQCAPLNSDHQLQAVFADARLAQWRGSVPQSYNTAGRVSLLVAQLLDAWNTEGENALALFLYVLYEQVGTAELCVLANEVQASAIEDKITGCRQELDQLEEHVRRGWADAAYASRRRAQLEADLAKWRTRRDAGELCAISQIKPDIEAGNISTRTTSTPPSVETYTDFEIHIFAANPETQEYPVKATLSDGADFFGKLCLNQEDYESLSVKKNNISGYGLFLFDALFAGDIRDAYVRAQTLAEVLSEGRLRLRLWIDNNAAELHALAWERLHHRIEGEAFKIATSTKLPFSRYIGLAQAHPAPVNTQPIQMLAVISNPKNLSEYDLTPINVDKEIENLLEALQDAQKIGLKVTLMPGRTGISEYLQARLTNLGYQIIHGPTSMPQLLEQFTHRHQYHILHLLAQGAFNKTTQHAALFLEDSQGTVHRCEDNVFVEGIRNTGELPHLIFLAACESAKHGTKNPNPFVGLAPRLIQIGVPAVVATQDTISFADAQKLTLHFYHRLLRHGIVDKAMNQARAFLARDEGTSWAIPVLFTRLKQGKLFVRE